MQKSYHIYYKIEMGFNLWWEDDPFNSYCFYNHGLTELMMLAGNPNVSTYEISLKIKQLFFEYYCLQESFVKDIEIEYSDSLYFMKAIQLNGLSRRYKLPFLKSKQQLTAAALYKNYNDVKQLNLLHLHLAQRPRDLFYDYFSLGRRTGLHINTYMDLESKIYERDRKDQKPLGDVAYIKRALQNERYINWEALGCILYNNLLHWSVCDKVFLDVFDDYFDLLIDYGGGFAQEVFDELLYKEDFLSDISEQEANDFEEVFYEESDVDIIDDEGVDIADLLENIHFSNKKVVKVSSSYTHKNSAQFSLKKGRGSLKKKKK